MRGFGSHEMHAPIAPRSARYPGEPLRVMFDHVGGDDSTEASHVRVNVGRRGEALTYVGTFTVDTPRSILTAHARDAWEELDRAYSLCTDAGQAAQRAGQAAQLAERAAERAAAPPPRSLSSHLSAAVRAAVRAWLSNA